MICYKCGYVNNSGINTCWNCGAELSNKMKPEDLDNLIDGFVDGLADYKDPLVASQFEIRFKYVCFILSGVSFIINAIMQSAFIVNVFSAGILFFAGVMAGYPNAMWELEKLRLSRIINEDDVTPSDIWVFWHLISYWVLLIIGIGYSVWNIFTIR